MYRKKKGILMGDLRINPFIEQNYNYGNYERGSRTVGVNPFTPVPAEEGGTVSGVAGINGEVSPKYLDTATTGSTYTNGVGHSKFGAFRPYLA